jgi:hypothetical protein
MGVSRKRVAGFRTSGRNGVDPFVVARAPGGRRDRRRGGVAPRAAGRVSVQAGVLRFELLSRLRVLRVHDDALVDRADLDAPRRLEGPDALGALLGVDDVDRITGLDRLVRALGLAGTAVDARKVVGEVFCTIHATSDGLDACCGLGLV